MQVLVLAQGLNDVPRETVDIDPSTFDPRGLRLANELNQFSVIHLVNLQVFSREVDDGNLTFSMKVRGDILSAVRLPGVNTGFCAWVPTRSQPLEVFKLF